MRHALVGSLRAHGVDVLTAFEAGMIEKPDEDHLAYATAQDRVLCTFNVRDFFRLHAEYQQKGRRHAGIILVAQQRYFLGDQVRRIGTTHPELLIAARARDSWTATSSMPTMVIVGSQYNVGFFDDS